MMMIIIILLLLLLLFLPILVGFFIFKILKLIIKYLIRSSEEVAMIGQSIPIGRRISLWLRFVAGVRSGFLLVDRIFVQS